jgi:hypothetical protein
MNNYYKTDNFKCHTNSMDTIKLHELLRNVFTATFLLLIATTNSSALDIHVLKAPSDGIEKMKKYSIVRSVDDDGYVIAGSTPVDNFTAMGVNVMFIDDLGTVVWSYYYGFPGQGFEATHIDYNTDSNGYVISGYTMREWSTPFQPRPFILEIDDLGTQMNNKFMDYHGVFFKVKPTPLGDYIAIGYVGDTSIVGTKDAVCVKFDDTLGILWFHHYRGDYTFATTDKGYEGVTAAYITFDGVNETYVLGGNFTGTFEFATHKQVPVIDIRELDMNGNIMHQHATMAFESPVPPAPDEGYDIMVQDILVIEDPGSPYHQDIVLVGQEFRLNNYVNGSPSNNLILARYHRNPIVRATNFLRYEGVSLVNYQRMRGNNIQYFESLGDDGMLILFGTLEDDVRQVPIMVEINPALNTSDLPCTYFTDGTPLIESKYLDNRLVFTDYLGTGSPSQLIIGGEPEQIFSHNLGYADLDGHNQLRYGIVATRRIYTYVADHSLFLVSNVDQDFCYNQSDEVEFDKTYEDFIDTFQVTSQTLNYIPSRDLDIFDQPANFQEALCSSTELIWNNVNDPAKNNYGISMYPNPAQSHIHIDGILDGDQLQIRDINGRILHNATLSKGQPVPIDHLPSGMYFIKLIRNKETVFLDKLSKL